MKNIFKNRLFIFVLGVVVSSTSIVLASNYLAPDIAYTPEDSNWKVTNVADALDDIHNSIEFKTYDMKDKTTVTGTGYTLNKVLLKNNAKDKIMYIKIEASVAIQDKNDCYTIDVSEFGINNVLDYKIYNYNNSPGVWRVIASTFNGNTFYVGADTNYGYGTKYNYDYIVIVLYN